MRACASSAQLAKSLQFVPGVTHRSVRLGRPFRAAPVVCEIALAVRLSPCEWQPLVPWWTRGLSPGSRLRRHPETGIGFLVLQTCDLSAIDPYRGVKWQDSLLRMLLAWRLFKAKNLAC